MIPVLTLQLFKDGDDFLFSKDGRKFFVDEVDFLTIRYFVLGLSSSVGSRLRQKRYRGRVRK